MAARRFPRLRLGPPRARRARRRRPIAEEPADEAAVEPFIFDERETEPEYQPPRRGRGGPSRETTIRVLVVIPWIAFTVIIVGVGGVPFALAMIALACIGINELFRMTHAARPFGPVAYPVVAGLMLAAHFSTGRVMAAVAGASLPLMFVFGIIREDRRNVTYSMAITVLGIAWIGGPFAHAVLLRDLPLHGGALLIDVLVATFLTDTCAYIGGRLFGNRPLAPTLSPNKTVEGLIAGFVGGTMGFWFAGLYQDWLTGADALLMGACVAAVAPVGDLFESMIKRDLEVKDSGRVFGPHGGLLDRLDAVLFTVVIGYYLSVALVY
jgi:phosphatidate cytidylyltransferase